MACSGGDYQVAVRHKRALKNTLIATAGTMGAAGIVTFLAPLFGGGGSVSGAPQAITAVQTVITDASGWMLALAPVGGGLVAAYHWFMSGPG